MPVSISSKYLKLLLIFCFFNTTHVLFSQEIDSLQNYSYEKLNTMFRSHFHKDVLVAKKYVETSLKKAIQEENHKEHAVALFRLSIIANKQDHFKTAHEYVDLAIHMCEEKVKDDDLKSMYIAYKGNIYYNATDYENALTYYTKAYEYQKEVKNTQTSLDIAHNIANVQSLVGEEEKAKQIYKENYIIYTALEKSESLDFNASSYVGTLIALSDTYLDEAINENKAKYSLLDSATYYNTIGFEKSEKYNDTDGYNYFLIRKAIISFEKKNYKNAIEDLNLSLEKANEIGQTETLTTIYFHLAKCYQELEKLDTSILMYKKVDSISNLDIEQSTYLSEVYIALTQIYIHKGEAENAIKYNNLFVAHDKANDNLTLKIQGRIYEDYEIPVLKDKIEALKKDTKAKDADYTKAIIFIALLLFSFLLFLIYYKKKQDQNQLTFDKLLLQLETEKNKTSTFEEKKNKTKLTIDEEKVQQILTELEKFEHKKYFLDVNCNLGFVAKKVKTNKAYLSKVIHSEKQQKFIQYITTLRINYALEELKENKLFRSYDIKSIATELGFKSPDSFSRAFKNKTGIYPSFYIKNINKINTSEDE